MTCYYPLRAWHSNQVNPGTGKRNMVFRVEHALHPDNPIELPCGQCIGCRLERSRQWAMRCDDEASLYNDNCFITLTYDRDNLPTDWSLNKTHFQKFMKRLRAKFVPKNPYHPDLAPKCREYFAFKHNIRFYMCGEYGSRENELKTNPEDIYMQHKNVGRPHYHALLFNFDFNDKCNPRKTDSGATVYESPTLTKIWGMGKAEVGNCTFESAAYVARYITKKINGPEADDHYTRIDLIDNTENLLHPEYTNCSTNPGIGKRWWKQYKSDLRKDFVTHRGIKMRPPEYYDKLLEEDDPEKFKIIKRNREKLAELHKEDSGRLRVKEAVKLKRIENLKRG